MNLIQQLTQAHVDQFFASKRAMNINMSLAKNEVMFSKSHLLPFPDKLVAMSHLNKRIESIRPIAPMYLYHQVTIGISSNGSVRAKHFVYVRQADVYKHLASDQIFEVTVPLKVQDQNFSVPALMRDILKILANKTYATPEIVDSCFETYVLRRLAATNNM